MSDYIKRDDVIDRLVRTFLLQAPTARAIVEAIPAADVVERKHGKWIGGELGHCSCCGHEGCASDIWNDGKINFCPNCGARLLSYDV